MLTYLTTVNTISAAAGSMIFLIVRFANVIWDPFVGAFVDKRKPTKNGKYRPYLIWFGIPLVIMGALLFLPIPAVQGSVIYAFLSYIATAMIYSLVNIPYGSLSSSLTRDVVEISKLTATRMFMACSAYFLVNTFFPLFVQLLSPLAEIKDIGMFGIQLPLGNYMTPAAAPADSVLNFL